MKKFRITLPVAALLLGVSTHAFTAAEKPTLVTYRYNLSSTAPGDILSGGNYVSGSSTSCNGGKSLSNMVSDLSFESGLTGIGWAIEWAVQHKLLLDTNTDEVLSDIDDALYIKIMYSKEDDMSFRTGILGKLKYFALRSKALIQHPIALDEE